MHPNISICTRKVIESIYDTRKIVKPKDRTEGIARMMVLDLRPIDIIEGVNFNELFIPVTNPNSFGNSDLFENLEIFWYLFQSRRNFYIFHKSNYVCTDSF